MWFITHIALGGALGTWIKRPIWLIVILALSSHLLLDMIPHWDYTTIFRWESLAIVDTLSGILLIALMMQRNRHRTACFLGGIFSALPDLEGLLIHYGYLSRYYFPSHIRPFPHGSSEMFGGILVQVLIVLVSLFVTMREKRD